MSYIKGGIITAGDFNVFKQQIDNILSDLNSGTSDINVASFGYGNSSTTDNVIINDLVSAGDDPDNSVNEWINLFNDLNTIREHQTGVVPFNPVPAVWKDIIDAIDTFESVLSLAGIDRTTTFTEDTSTELTDTRTATWNGQINSTIQMTATNWDELRYFFNSGGTIKLEPTYITGGGPNDQTWVDLILDIDDIVFDYTSTHSTGQTGEDHAIGFYQLNDTEEQLLYFKTNSPNTNTDTISVWGILDAPAGTAISLTLRVGYSSSTSTDNVTGTIGVTSKQSIATGNITIVPPTYAQTEVLDTGGTPVPILSATLTSAPSTAQSCIIGIDQGSGGCPTQYILTMTVNDKQGNLSFLWAEVDVFNIFTIIDQVDTATTSVLTVDSTSTVPITAPATFQCAAIDDGRTINTSVSRSIGLNNAILESTDAIVITQIDQAGVGAIYLGVGDSAVSNETCQYNVGGGNPTCTNQYDFTVIVGGYQSAGVVEYTWTLSSQVWDNQTDIWNNDTTIWNDARGPFDISRDGSGNQINYLNVVTLTTILSDADIQGENLIVTVNTPNGQDSVFIALTSIHENDNGDLTASISGGGTQTCRYDDPADCGVTYNLTVAATGGSVQGVYTYLWSSSDPTNYPITPGEETLINMTVVTLSGQTDLPSNLITCLVTDNNGTDTVSPTTIIEALRRPDAISSTSINVDFVDGDSSCTYSRDPTPTADENDDTFCRESTEYSATPTGGSGGYSYFWTLSGLNVPLNAYFAADVGDDAGTTTSTADVPRVISGNEGFTPDTTTRNNDVGYTIDVVVTDTDDRAASSSTNIALISQLTSHEDITTTIDVSIVFSTTGGSCEIESGDTSCVATSTHQIAILAGTPDDYLWELTVNPNDAYSFAVDGSTTSTITTVTNVDITSTSAVTLGDAILQLSVRKEGQEDIVRTLVFNHVRTYIIPIWFNALLTDQFTTDDAMQNNRVGTSVAISGDGSVAIIGALFGTDDEHGAAYIFTNSAGIWTQVQKLEPIGASPQITGSDAFGYSLAMSTDGNTAVVGAYGEESDGNSAGAAYIYINEEGSWAQEARLLASDSVPKTFGRHFGYDVAISADGNIVVITAEDADVNGVVGAGTAYVFTRIDDDWTETQILIAGDVQKIGDNFGISCAISGDGVTIMIGNARRDNGAILNAGALYVFTKSLFTWNRTQILTVPDGEVDDQLSAYSTAISNDGTTAITSSINNDIGDVPDAGAVYVFANNNNSWTQQSKLIAGGNAIVDNQFGRSISISVDGNTVGVGATGGFNIGTMYMFNRTSGIWSETTSLQATDTYSGSYYAGSSAISGDGTLLLVGSPLETDVETFDGAVYSYDIANGEFDLTLGTDGTDAGFIDGSIGSIDPIVFGVYNLTELYVNSVGILFLTINAPFDNITQDYYIDLSIQGTVNRILNVNDAATFSGDTNSSTWTWIGQGDIFTWWDSLSPDPLIKIGGGYDVDSVQSGFNVVEVICQENPLEPLQVGANDAAISGILYGTIDPSVIQNGTLNISSTGLIINKTFFMVRLYPVPDDWTLLTSILPEGAINDLVSNQTLYFFDSPTDSAEWWYDLSLDVGNTVAEEWIPIADNTLELTFNLDVSASLAEVTTESLSHIGSTMTPDGRSRRIANFILRKPTE